MIIEIKYIFLLVAFALAEKQIDLEDIERDTLISEQRNNVKESLKTDQTQHLRPPAINAGSSPYEKSSSEQAENDVAEDIAYAPQQNDGAEEYEAQQQIQYVTPQQYEQQYNEPQLQQLYGEGHPVHEAHHTYSAPARQSLINPIVPKQNTGPSPYLAQQPRYVYVQAGQQQVSPNGVVTYAPHQRPTEQQVQAQQEQQDINYASVASVNAQQQQQQVQVGHAHAQRPSATYGPPQASYVQYLPFLAQTPNHQSYIMVLPFRSIPSHTQAIAIPQVPFTYSLRQHHGPHVQLSNVHPSPTPGVSYTHSAPAEENAVLHAPEPTPIPTPSASIPYRIPSAGYAYTAAHPVTYAQQHLQVQPSIAYELPPQQSIVYHHPKPVLHPQVLQQSPHYHPGFASNLDFFAPYKQPASLLESYVPSSVILARQRALQSRQLLHPVLQNPSQYGNHQPGYNTIAYSTHQSVSYAKRSPKAVTTSNAKSANTNTSSNSSNSSSNNAKKN